MEGGGGGSQLPLHRLYCLPQLPPRVPGGLWYWDLHPRFQADPAGCGLEGGGATLDIPVPAQGIQLFLQVQVHVYTGGLWHGYQGPPPPPQVLKAA